MAFTFFLTFVYFVPILVTYSHTILSGTSFLTQKMRILLLCENKHVLARLICMFAEQRVLRIRDFEVCLDEATTGGTLYIKAISRTQVEHILPSSNRYPQSLPSHCFDLVTISEVLDKRSTGRGLVGK